MILLIVAFIIFIFGVIDYNRRMKIKPVILQEELVIENVPATDVPSVTLVGMFTEQDLPVP